MKLGIAQPPLWDSRSTVDLIVEAEDLGFASAWIADQTFHSDPYVLLASAAERTTSITLGLGLTNPTTRHPSVTARAAAAVAALTGPRFNLGLGAGNTRELLEPLGLLSDRPSKTLTESVVVIRSLLEGTKVDFEGEFFRVRGVTLEMDLDTQIPIFIGGRGERILELAGREADGVILSVAGHHRTWDIVESAAKQRGRSQESIYKLAWGELILDPTGDEIESQRHILGHVLGRAPVAGLLVLGLDPALIEAIKGSYETEGIPGAARHVSREMMDRHMLIGTSEHCLERLAAMAVAGFQEYAVLMKSPDKARRSEQIQKIARTLNAELP